MAQKGNKTQPKYRPPKWAWKFVEAYLDPDVKQTITAVCEAIGINKSTYYRAREKSGWDDWFQRTLLAAADVHLVKAALLKLCAKGDLDAIKHYHEVYGNFIPTMRQQFQDLEDVSSTELERLQRLLAGESFERTDTSIH